MRTLLRGAILAALGIGLALPVHVGMARAVTDVEFREAEAGLEKSPQDDAKRAQLARLHYLKGSDLSLAGNHEGAVAAFKTGLAILETKVSKVSEQHPVYEELRYGLGYSELMLNRPQDAVVVLDQLVASSARHARARYLLGIALLSVATEATLKRGIEVLGQLSRDSQGTQDATAATHAVSRYVYNFSIGMALSGKAGPAVQAMQDVRDRVGASSGADAVENQAYLYGMGQFQLMAGHTAAGMAEFAALKAQNPNFQTKSGYTVTRALSNP
jgi:tetratricopeptide (TPR) repeat protein